MRVAILTTDSREHFKTYDAPGPYFGTSPEALFQGFRALKEPEVHIISCLQRPVRPYEKIAENIFFHGLHVPRNGWMRTLYSGCVRAVRKKLREIRPDVVHGQGTERDCALSAVRSGFPNVITIHGNMAELARLFGARFGSFGWLAARLEDFALKRTAGVFCNSGYTESLVKSRARRTWRVANPLRLEFLAEGTHPAKNRRCTLLNVGVITPRKRQLELLQVVEALRALGLDFEFQFIGEARPQEEYAARFLQQAGQLEAAGFVRFVGTKSATELVDCFDRAHGLVHFPSEEAFGLVAAEALARDLKFFGARLGGLVDIAADAPAAELLSPDDYPALTASIAAWISRGFPPANGAADLMRSRYHPEVIARRHFEIYREVLSSAS